MHRKFINGNKRFGKLVQSCPSKQPANMRFALYFVHKLCANAKDCAQMWWKQVRTSYSLPTQPVLFWNAKHSLNRLCHNQH